MTLILLMLVARDRAVMGTYRIRVALAVAGYVVTAVGVLASGIYLWETFASGGGL